MKSTRFLINVITTGLLASCSMFTDTKAEAKAYASGYRAGMANEAKRRYWADQNAVLPEIPSENAQFTPVTVPEHTAPDGVIIEEHEVVNPNLVTP